MNDRVGGGVPVKRQPAAAAVRGSDERLRRRFARSTGLEPLLGAGVELATYDVHATGPAGATSRHEYGSGAKDRIMSAYNS